MPIKSHDDDEPVRWKRRMTENESSFHGCDVDRLGERKSRFTADAIKIWRRFVVVEIVPFGWRKSDEVNRAVRRINVAHVAFSSPLKGSERVGPAGHRRFQ